MATITGLTKDRMIAIEAASVVGGVVDGAGHLILTKHDASTIDAGYVVGPVGPVGPPDVNSVKITGAQSINGNKTFIGGVEIGGPGLVRFDPNGGQAGLLPASSVSVGYDSLNLNIWDNVGNRAFRLYDNVNGVARFAVNLGNTGVGVQVGGADSYFGPYAFPGGTGVTRAHILAAPTGVIIYAEGDGANRDLAVQVKGTGIFLIYGGASNLLAQVTSTGNFYAVGNDHYIGPNASGAAGSRFHLGAASASSVSITAESTGPDVQIVYGAKGGGSHIFQSSGVTKTQFDSTGQISSIGAINKFGRGALGATGIAHQLNEDGTNLFHQPVGTPADIDLIIRPKGTTTGAVRIQSPGGTNLIVASAVTNTVTIAQQAWQAAVLTNGWLNSSAPWAQAGYLKDSMGFLHLKGLIVAGTIGLAAFTLPVGYRPVEQLMVVCQSNSGFKTGRIDIYTNGQVIPQAPADNSWVALDGIVIPLF